MARTKRYAGTLRQRGTTWQLVVWSPAEKKARTYTLGGAATLEEAEQLAEEKDRELRKEASRVSAGLPGAIRFSALLDRFEAERLPTLAPNSRKAYRSCIKRFREWFVEGRLADPMIATVRTGHVTEYLSWRRTRVMQTTPKGAKLTGRVAKASTVNTDRTTLSAIFTFAEELELREGNPVAKAKAPKGDPRTPVLLSPEQYEALVEECAHSPMLRLYVLALGETGGRCESEVLHLKWEDVDLQEGFLWIASGRDGHRTKGGRGRWVPMTPRLIEAMRAHFAVYRFSAYDGKPTPWVIHHTTSQRNAKAGQRVRSLRQAFTNAARRAGLPADLHQHDLRHRRVTTWLAAGANPVHVKEAVGHASLATTMAYTHLAREHLRSLIPTEIPRPERDELKELGA